MTSGNTERLEHRASFSQDDSGQHRADAIEKLWHDSGNMDPKEMDSILWREQQGSDSDRAQTKWQQLQDALSQNKLEDSELTAFARNAAEYRKSVRDEILNDPEVTREYMFRDHLLVDKVDSVDSNLLAHTLTTIAERSNWYPLPGGQQDNHDKYRELVQMARQGRWEQIPDRIREMHSEATGPTSQQEQAA